MTSSGQGRVHFRR